MFDIMSCKISKINFNIVQLLKNSFCILQFLNGFWLILHPQTHNYQNANIQMADNIRQILATHGQDFLTPGTHAHVL